MNDRERTQLPEVGLDPSFESQFPLLSALLREKGLRPKGTYTYADVQQILGGSRRALQELVTAGRFTYRNLPGRAHWLSVDLETFLTESVKTPKPDGEQK